MKIGIDISQISYEGTGVARFTRGLVNTILQHDKQNRWYFFFFSLRQNLDPELQNNIIRQKHHLIKRKIPSVLLALINNQIHNRFLSSIFYPLSSNLDWFITSDWTEPPLSCKKATVVHDLAYLRFPETVDETIKKTQQQRLRWVKKESRIVFSDSDSTKKDIDQLLGIDPKKIATIYPGVTIPSVDAQQIQRTRKKYSLDKPFILTVGKTEPRKNFDRLIRAFLLIDDPALDLVIAGPRGWAPSSTQHHLSPHIKYLGYVNDQDLSALYASCLFFVYPSLWEGFGYPIVEAMRLNAPIGASNTSSIKEIIGTAGLLFDPFDVDDIKRCLLTLKQNGPVRKRLAQKGKARSKIFTWENYYNTLMRYLR